MNKIATRIQLTDMAPAWGLVCVTDSGNIVRAHRITVDALRAFEADGTLPPCVTAEELAQGRVIIAARPCLPGQGIIQPDGSMVINYGIKDDGQSVHVSLMRIYPREYEVIDGAVHMARHIARQVDLEHAA